MNTRRKSANIALTQNEFEITDRSRLQRVFWRAVFLLLLATGLATALIFFESSRANDEQVLFLESENTQLWAKLRELTEQLERTELDLEIAEVTQQEIERQAAVLREQLDQVREELEFIKEQR